jgi:NTP pyrophosphatase (non-canonical NTP hydrolase)
MRDNETSFDYISEAAVTCSPGFHGDRIKVALFMAVLARCAEALRDLDAIKKALFYGRSLPEHLTQIEANLSRVDMHNLPSLLGETDNVTSQGAIDILHSVIGTATEAGEQLEMILRWVSGSPLDKTNLFEEIGDTQWYAAIALRVLGKNFDQVQRANIAKLRQRFPNKFTEYDANNRNVTAELNAMDSAGTIHGEGSAR